MNCAVRVDGNGQKWVQFNGGSMRADLGFEKKWIVLRAVSEHKLSKAYPHKFGLCFKYQQIDLEINGRFETNCYASFETLKRGRDALDDFWEHIRENYSGYNIAIASFNKKLSEKDFKGVRIYSFYASCSDCGYESKNYDSFYEVCSEYPDDLCDCGYNTLDIRKEIAYENQI